MTKIQFRSSDGRPVADAVVAITGAPAEMTDLGYMTDREGAITLTLPTPGAYVFVLTGADGRVMTGTGELPSVGEAVVTVA